MQFNKALHSSPASFTDAIRAAAADISARARFIRIREDRIAPYAEFLLSRYPIHTELPEDMHFVSETSPEQTASYVLALDSINFGSGYFHVARQAGVALEYDVIAKGLKLAFLQNRLNTPEKWRLVTPAECHDAFGIPAETHESLDQLMWAFAKHLSETGRIITEEYDGKVMNLIRSAGGSAMRLAQTVAAWPTFADAPFYKRAQIFAADIHLAFGGEYFADAGALTMFADNMVAHVLRTDGVLEYDAGLAARIDAQQLIAAGSDEEQELRGVALHAVELISRATNGRATPVNIDHILWNRGYEPEIYARPPHRTMTVWY